MGLGKRFKIGAGGIRPSARREWRTGMGAASARHGQMRVLKRAARMCLRCARRQANWLLL
jgi:hypothetical protein